MNFISIMHNSFIIHIFKHTSQDLQPTYHTLWDLLLEYEQFCSLDRQWTQ